MDSLTDLRVAMSAWLTAALSVEPGPTVFDLDELRGWIDGGCAGEMPWPKGDD